MWIFDANVPLEFTHSEHGSQGVRRKLVDATQFVKELFTVLWLREGKQNLAAEGLANEPESASGPSKQRKALITWKLMMRPECPGPEFAIAEHTASDLISVW